MSALKFFNCSLPSIIFKAVPVSAVLLLTVGQSPASAADFDTPHRNDVSAGSVVASDDEYLETAYFAVGEKDTEIYEFDVASGATIPVHNIPSYGPGFKALGWRKTDKKLYAANGNQLMVIDPVIGELVPHTVEGLPSNVQWINGDITPDGSTFIVARDPWAPSYTIDLTSGAPYRARPLNSPGEGGWYD